MKKALLDNKTECEIVADNGILAQIQRNNEKIIVFSFRLTIVSTK